MLRIRLRRVGKKGNPSYRIVVAEATAPRDGAYLEWIGNYDPMVDPPTSTIKEDRAAQWLSRGAQPSDAVRRILDKAGILDRIPQQLSAASAAKAGTDSEAANGASAAPAAVEKVADEPPADEAPAAVADEPPADEAPATVADEPPADGAPAAVADEPPADEAPAAVADEPPADEAPAEETPDEASTK